MPLLSQDKLIAQYYEEVKDKYPNVPFDQFVKVCKAPTEFIKSVMKSGSLAFIYIKHIGKFVVFPSAIKKRIRIETKSFQRGDLYPEIHENNMKFYEWYLGELNKLKTTLQDEKTIRKFKKDSIGGETTD